MYSLKLITVQLESKSESFVSVCASRTYDVCSMCMILQAGGHGHSHSSITRSSPRRTAHVRSAGDPSYHLSASSDDMVTVTTRTMSHEESRNINVQAAFIHVIGDLLQSFGVLVAAYIIFYKVFADSVMSVRPSVCHTCGL